MTTIKANVSKMFSHRDPWDCSNSAANLGPNAGQLTWDCALEVAENASEWLLSPVSDACEGIQEWARDTGAWDADEIAAWPDTHCLALFVQNVASELRDHLDSDNQGLTECATKYAETDWEQESCSPIGYYVQDENEVTVDYYTGC